MKTLGIVVPVYREEAGIESFHRRLTNAIAPLSGRYQIEICYVLDKSPDATEAKLKQLAGANDGLTLLVLSRRFGHQAALGAGIDHCKTDAVIMLDGDLQHPPEMIPAMVERFEAGADIVQMIREDAESTNLITRLTSRYFYRALNRMASIDIPVGAADFRLISGRIAEVFRTKLNEHNQFFRGLAFWVGYNVVLLPFKCDDRELGRTNYSFRRRVAFAVSGICSLSKAPLRACIMAGITLAILSFILGGIQIALYFTNAREVPGWASLMLGLSFASGIQLIFLGIIGEYVGLIFDEVKRRPNYLVEGVYSRKKTPG